MNFDPPLPLPPTEIPEDILQLPEGFSWAGNTKERYPHINNSKGHSVAIIWPNKLIWNGVTWNKNDHIPTSSYQEGMRLAHTLLMLGDE